MSLLDKHIFISKNPGEVILLQREVDTNGGFLEASSLISFVPVKFDIPPKTEIIFFSSPRGVEFFTRQSSIPTQCRIACVGKATQEKLLSIGYTPEFVGENNRSIEDVARDFKEFVGVSTVLFPSSDISLGTIASAIPENQRKTLIVYQTKLDSREVAPSDVYVFTSPSNVRSFFMKNHVATEALVIAWGNSTAKELNAYEITPKILGTPSLKCLIDILSEA